MSSTALALPFAPSLYEIEQDLAALLDTEALVTEEQEAEFRGDLAVALEASVEKRDRVGQFLRHCDMQAANCDTEIKRLQERKKSFEAAEGRMRQYVQLVIEGLGPDAKGKPKKLEGKAITFSLRACPVSVEIADPGLVPSAYKTVTVTLPMPLWQSVLASVPDLDRNPLHVSKAIETISRTAVKAAIDRGEEVPGADLNIGGYSLVVK